jgi:alkanesulfonate monooxygenase SsuD/methylene tetrahydromethanopterin reductase-like flavin-dependent oxidoreductase (luciferase family)
MDLGFHIADFTWDGGPPDLAPTLGRLAREAEAGGIARLTVMDHYWQIGPVGAPEESMLEAYTTLGYLAAVTERVLLHTLVTGVVYRQPGFLAKVVSTLDVLSGGRAGLGIGAAWFQGEAEGLGFDFPPLGERFERLEETLQICLQMWGKDDSAFDGRHYQLGAGEEGVHGSEIGIPLRQRLHRGLHRAHAHRRGHVLGCWGVGGDLDSGTQVLLAAVENCRDDRAEVAERHLMKRGAHGQRQLQ